MSSRRAPPIRRTLRVSPECTIPSSTRFAEVSVRCRPIDGDRAPGPSRSCSRCRRCCCYCVKRLYRKPHRKCQEAASKIKLPVSASWFSHWLVWPLGDSRDVLRCSSALMWLLARDRSHGFSEPSLKTGKYIIVDDLFLPSQPYSQNSPTCFVVFFYWEICHQSFTFTFVHKVK